MKIKKIEEECNGKPVSPVGKKERKSDLTQEIKKFLSEPVTLDSIKRILILMYVKHSDYFISKSELEIYTPLKSKNTYKGFVITIYLKNMIIMYYLDSWGLCRLCNFPEGKIKISDLKREFCYTAYEYLRNNIKHLDANTESQ